MVSMPLGPAPAVACGQPEPLTGGRDVATPDQGRLCQMLICLYAAWSAVVDPLAFGCLEDLVVKRRDDRARVPGGGQTVGVREADRVSLA